MKHFFVLNLYLLVEWYQSEAIIFRRFSDTGVFFCHCYFHFQGQLQDYSTKRGGVRRPVVSVRVMQSAGLLYHQKKFS